MKEETTNKKNTTTKQENTGKWKARQRQNGKVANAFVHMTKERPTETTVQVRLLTSFQITAFSIASQFRKGSK